MKISQFIAASGIVLALSFSALPVSADEYVHGYTRANGTEVQGYTRSSPDNTVTNNYSYQGNVNPYTGSTGTNTYQHDTTSPYYNGTPDSNGHTGHAGGLYGGQNNNGLGQ